MAEADGCPGRERPVEFAFARDAADRLVERDQIVGRGLARGDLALLEREHQALELAIRRVLKTPRAKKLLPALYGVAFHDIYHAGQIRLLRRMWP